MRLDDFLRVVEKIDHGIADRETQQIKFLPLRYHPFLCEKFLALLKAIECQELIEECRCDLLTICNLFCIDFSAVLAEIDILTEEANDD